MRLSTFDVVWVWDASIRPPGSKMIVCVDFSEGEFLRINTLSRYKPCVPICRDPHHMWLEHDSHIECNLLIFDDYYIGEALKIRGVIGAVDSALKPNVLNLLMRSGTVPNADKARITSVLS